MEKVGRFAAGIANIYSAATLTMTEEHRTRSPVLIRRTGFCEVHGVDEIVHRVEHRLRRQKRMLRDAAVFAVEESLERLKVERADVLGERHLPEFVRVSRNFGLTGNKESGLTRAQ